MGMGRIKKTLRLSGIDLEENLFHPLIGFHANDYMSLHYTGNDYMSSIFRKGEKKNVLGY